jgi:hydroxypyruvate isomerase
VTSLRFAARELTSAGIRLLIEPINPFDVPGFFLRSTDQAAAIRTAVGSDNLFLQFDVYHMAIVEQDVIAALHAHQHWVGHVQVADVPGRHEPGTGAVDFPALFAQLDAAGYTGAVGCEYYPRAGTIDGLDWAAPYGVSASGGVAP